MSTSTKFTLIDDTTPAPIDIIGTLDSSVLTNNGLDVNNIKTVHIGTRVTSIGIYTFQDAKQLETVTFAADSLLETIGIGAFKKATSLTSITIPTTVTSIGFYAFEESGLSSITIPASVTTIEIGTFKKTAKLTSISIPTTVTNIGFYAFEESGLTSVTFATDSLLETIGIGAFKNTTELTSITIPTNVTSIADSAFQESSLKKAYMSSEVLNRLNLSYGYTDDFYGTPVTILPGPEYTVFVLSSGQSPIYIDIVGELNISSYSVEPSLITSVEIGTNVTSIRSYTFTSATNLISITISASVTSIDSYAFSKFNETTNLSSVIFEQGSQLTSINVYTFSGAPNLTSITIPASVSSIGNHAFSGATTLTSITIPKNVTTIGGDAFSGATSLSSIIFEEGSQLTTIYSYAFNGTTSLTSIIIPASVTSIGNYAFSKFDETTNLSSVIFEQGSQLTSINGYTFSGATSLTEIIIPTTVKTIGVNAFAETKITEIIIPDSVTSIGDNAFQESALKKVYMSTTVLNRLNLSYGYTDDFYGTPATILPGPAFVKFILSSGQSPIYIDVGSELTILSYYYEIVEPSLITSVEIGTNVTSIGTNAFSGATNLTTVTFEQGSMLSIIKEKAFRYLNALITVSFPQDSILENIENYAFELCQNLENITIPNTVTTIGDSIFYLNRKLKSIHIPASVTSIGRGGIAGITMLDTITIDSNNQQYSSTDDVLFTSDKINLLTYPMNKPGNKYVVPNSVTNLSDLSFLGVKQLTEINLPNSINSIGSNAFYNALLLKKVYIYQETINTLNAANPELKLDYGQSRQFYGTIVDLINPDNKSSPSTPSSPPFISNRVGPRQSCNSKYKYCNINKKTNFSSGNVTNQSATQAERFSTLIRVQSNMRNAKLIFQDVSLNGYGQKAGGPYGSGSSPKNSF